MTKGKDKGKDKDKGKHKKTLIPISTTTSPSPTSPSTASTSTPATTIDTPIATDATMYSSYEHIMSFDDQPMGGSSSGHQMSMPGYKKKKSIKSDASVDIKGPMEVDGSIKSMGAVTMTGDFIVRDRVEAYGNIDLDGNMTCRYVPMFITGSEKKEEADILLPQWQTKVIWKRQDNGQRTLPVSNKPDLV
jgi:hypothetical protein